jgi:hypothetical protein
MMTTMRPCSGTSLPAADDPPGVPVSTSPLAGGFIIWRCGAHDDGTGSIAVRELQITRNMALRLLNSRSSCPRTEREGTMENPEASKSSRYSVPGLHSP